MVLSKIDQNINYLESNNLDKNDEGESYAYRAKIFGKKVKFVLGKPNFQFIDNNIVYFNIYLVKNTELVSKIGIFETKNTSYRDLLDVDGNVVIEILMKMLKVKMKMKLKVKVKKLLVKIQKLLVMMKTKKMLKNLKINLLF
jgi:hypothetical protein